MSTEIDRRDFHRVRVDSLCTYTAKNQDIPTQATLKDLSSSGMLLWVNQAYAIGEQLKVCITPLNPITPGLSATIEILRCEEVDIELSYKRFSIACKTLSMS